MVAPVPESQSPENPIAEASPVYGPAAFYEPIVKLAALHAEAEETARLANLLGGSLHAALLPFALALATVFLTHSIGALNGIVWLTFTACATLAMLYAYLGTIRQPFSRLRLRRFARQLSGMLLFAGFAWGAGAYLVLPAGTGLPQSLLFAAVPGLVVAFSLREREATILFLTPVALLTSFASVLSPFAEGTLGAGLILLVCAAICAVAMLRDPRQTGGFVKPAMLPLK
jgi:hypothetical protein